MTITQETGARGASRAQLANVGGLLGFGTMIVVQIAGGVDDYPTVPPGLVITLAVVAVLVLGRRRRWTAWLGAVWPAMLVVGAVFADGSLEALTGGRGAFVQVTSILQRLTLTLALVSGIVAVAQRYRQRPSLATRPDW